MAVKAQVVQGAFDLKRSFDDFALVPRLLLAVDEIKCWEE